MFGQGQRTHQTITSGSVDSPLTVSRSSNASLQSSALPPTATESSAASIMSSPIQPETPTDGYEETESCSLEAGYWAHQDDGKSIEFDYDESSDSLPTVAEMDKAAGVQLYDADGTARTFKSLYTGIEHQGQRQLIIFVRHFYCGGCQHYLKMLSETITPSLYFSLPIPTTISIIGCGHPRLIPKYTTRSGCPFRVYADPSRKLYKALGMRHSVRIGSRPEYTPMNAIKLMLDSFYQMSKESRKDTMSGFKLVGGPMTQIGGEFLFGDGEVIWCHRMRNVRNHTTMGQLRKVLEMENETEEDDDDAVPVPLSPSSQAKGLRLVWDGNGVNAHLQRDSRLIEHS